MYILADEIYEQLVFDTPHACQGPQAIATASRESFSPTARRVLLSDPLFADTRLGTTGFSSREGMRERTLLIGGFSKALGGGAEVGSHDGHMTVT